MIEITFLVYHLGAEEKAFDGINFLKASALHAIVMRIRTRHEAASEQIPQDTLCRKTDVPASD